MASVIKQCLEFSPFPTPQSLYVLLILELKATTKSFPKMRHSVPGVTWTYSPRELVCVPSEGAVEFYLCAACALFRKCGCWRLGSLLPLVTGGHDFGPVGTPCLPVKLLGSGEGTEFCLTSLFWLPLLQSLALPPWRTGLCHLSSVVSSPVPVTAHIGVEGSWWWVSGTRQAQFLSSRSSVPWEVGEA